MTRNDIPPTTRDVSQEYKVLKKILWDYPLGNNIRVVCKSDLPLTEMRGALEGLSPDPATKGKIMVGKVWITASEIKEVYDSNGELLYSKTQ